MRSIVAAGTVIPGTFSSMNRSAEAERTRQIESIPSAIWIIVTFPATTIS